MTESPGAPDWPDYADTPEDGATIMRLEKEHDQLAKRLEEAERVIAWYADEENYNGERAPTYDQKTLTNDPESTHDFGCEYDSGQKAREFLGRKE